MVLVATQVKRRRGTNNENDAFAGAEGEITVDLTNKELRVHDGSGKKGGFRVGHYSYSSNCITEIPQDINLTLSNGTLTLKAGSKVYFADGSSYTTTSDKTRSGGASGKQIIVYRKTSNDIVDMGVSQCYSGTTQPTDVTYAVWFDTTNNIVKWTRDGFVNWQECSFPVALTTFTGGVPTSIDQIFNGFGYIGSTIFALPGVRGLIPNGRNADGSLNNILTTPATTVKTSTAVSGNTGRKTMTITSSGVIDRSGGLEYNERENRNYNFGSRSGQCACGHFTVGSDYKITNFVVKTAFHAVDYNDTEYIAHQAMPSGSYIDLTLGASGTAYTVPAIGYVCIRQAILSNGFLQVDVNGISYVNALSINSQATWCIPVQKGDIYTIYHSNIDTSFANKYLRFKYANGSK